MAAAGFRLARSTLTSLTHRSGDLLQLIYEAQLDSVVSGGIVTMDETPIKAGRKHEGEGEIKHQEKFEARITAEVIEVLPNGTLMIEARKRVSIGEERSELILTGRIRPQDIRAGNTVDSDRVADSHIQYRPKGAIGDTNKRGWIHRLFDFINIF